MVLLFTLVPTSRRPTGSTLSALRDQSVSDGCAVRMAESMDVGEFIEDFFCDTATRVVLLHLREDPPFVLTYFFGEPSAPEPHRKHGPEARARHPMDLDPMLSHDIRKQQALDDLPDCVRRRSDVEACLMIPRLRFRFVAGCLTGQSTARLHRLICLGIARRRPRESDSAPRNQLQAKRRELKEEISMPQVSSKRDEVTTIGLQDVPVFLTGNARVAKEVRTHARI